MGTFISVLIIVVCILLILTVLVQNSKGGGLSSTFSASNQIAGVRRTTDFLEKFTTGLAIALAILCMISAPFSKAGGATEQTTQESVTKKKAQETPPPAAPISGQENVNLPNMVPTDSTGR